jgi:hypothetical protein
LSAVDLVFANANAKVLERILYMYEDPEYASIKPNIERLLKFKFSHPGEDGNIITNSVLEAALKTDEDARRIIQSSLGLMQLLGTIT